MIKKIFLSTTIMFFMGSPLVLFSQASPMPNTSAAIENTDQKISIDPFKLFILQGDFDRAKKHAKKGSKEEKLADNLIYKRGLDSPKTLGWVAREAAAYGVDIDPSEEILAVLRKLAEKINELETKLDNHLNEKPKGKRVSQEGKK